MSSNQRLILAVVLSFLFLVGYTTLFPQALPVEAENNVSKTSLVIGENAQAINTATAQAANNSTPTGATKDVDVQESNTLVTVESSAFTVQIDTLGRIASKILKDKKYLDEDGNKAELIPNFGAKPLFIRFATTAINDEAMKTPYTASTATLNVDNGSQSVALTQKLSALTITKNLTFYADGHYDIKIELTENERFYLYTGKHPEITEQMMTVVGTMIYGGATDKLTTIYEDGDVEGRVSFNDVDLVSSFDQYYATILFGFSPDVSVYVERDRDNNPVTYLDLTGTTELKGYVGDKNYKTLESISPVLVNAIEYGWFTFASAPLFKLLSWLHGFFGNWGFAIIALTLLIRIVLYPLTYKGMLSMAKMKDLAPKIKEIQAKHKGDPQRMNAAVMDTYKKNGANPLGGCLPLLLQIPVFFAIYRVLLNAVELQGAEFILWIGDLSRMDQYYVLPILMGASMYYQQKLTPTNYTDPMQEKIFKFLPIIFTFFFLTFPSGLVLYWFVNNLFSIAQQFMVNRAFAASKVIRHEAHLAEKNHDKN